MYLEHFKLRELPFRLSPDPAFLYPSQSHSRAKAYMESTIWFTDGFVIITGEIGSGKTTLIETFLKELVQDEVVAQLNQTQISPIEFLQTLLAQFGFNPFRMRKAELLSTLNNFLIEQHSAGRKVLLIIDEAQNLNNKVLEEVRLLSGVETTKEKVLRIILAGQPELNQKLDSPELVQLKQRVRLRFHLGALNEQEMGSYIRHRLDVAGAEGREIFAPDTFPQLYRYTGGIPRLINTLCDTAMMEAFAKDLPDVSLTTLNTAIAELQWQEYGSHTHTDLPVSQLDDTSPHLRLPVGRIVLSLKGVKLDESALLPGRFVIGRTPDNDMQVESKFVSRHHAQLITNPGGTVVEDLNSTNGVYLNGKRVRRHRLVAGDVIKLGVHELTYKSPDILAHDEAHATRTTVLGHDLDDDEDEEDGLESVGEREEPRADAEESGDARDARGETYSSRARGS